MHPVGGYPSKRTQRPQDPSIQTTTSQGAGSVGDSQPDYQNQQYYGQQQPQSTTPFYPQQPQYTAAPMPNSSFIPQPNQAAQFIPPPEDYMQQQQHQQNQHQHPQQQTSQPFYPNQAQPFYPQQMSQQPFAQPFYAPTQSASPYSNSNASSGPGQNIFGDPTAQLGLQIGNQMLHAGQEYVNKNLGGYLPSGGALKTYFDVSNAYVLQKIAIILFPFRHRHWQRTTAKDPASNNYVFQPPRDDVNSPDLYIPLMAAVTYVLLVGVILGLRRSFQPERLGVTATAAVIFIFVELALVKLGTYLLNFASDVSLLDMLAIIGYNFVPLIVTLLADLLLGRIGKYSAFLYSSLAMAFFMLRSLRYSFVPESSVGPSPQRRSRVHFLFAIVAIQIVCSYFLLV